MNRGIRHFMVVVIAVATAGLASFGVYRAVTRIPVREVEVAPTFVVVATASLPPGVRLSAADVRLAAWPQSSPVPGSFSKVDAVVHHALLASGVENEPILPEKLAIRGPRLSSSSGLKNGKRARPRPLSATLRSSALERATSRRRAGTSRRRK